MYGTEHINDDLTDEEREAMIELEAQLADTDADDPLFNPGEVVKGEGEQEEEEEQEQAEALTPEEEQAKADEEAAAKVLADEAAKVAADAAEAAKPKEEPPQARAPILLAEAPEDAEAQLTEIATKKAALSDKFDDGELTSKEYQAELDKLSKEERTLERSIDKAQIARDLEDQRLTNERDVEINTFLAEIGIPRDTKNLRFRVLDTAVIDVASDEANVKLSAREVMQKAYELCISEGALQPKKSAEAKPAVTKAKTPIVAPPNLANLPASEITSTEDNRFAYLNRITDPDKREAAFNKLSANDQEAYLATGG